MLVITLQIAVLLALTGRVHSEEFAPTVTQNVETPQGQVEIAVSYPDDAPKDSTPFTFAIKILKPLELNLIPNDLNGQYGDFDFVFVSEKRDKKNDKQEIVTRIWNLYPANEGVQRIPPIPLFFETSDKETLVVEIPAKELYVVPSKAVFPNTEVAFYLEPIRSKNWGGLLGAVVLVLIVTILLQKGVLSFLRKKKRALFMANIRQESPFDRAIRLLTELTSTSSIELGARPFYTDVDFIFRSYLSSTYNLKTQGQTTEEIVRSLQKIFEATTETPGDSSLNGSEQSEILSEIINVLRELDLCKFTCAPSSQERMTLISRQVENAVKRIHESALSPNPPLLE
ncbi:MAG: hypothetical protein ACI4NP_03045 [Thermoguttaceae bacterium]